MDNRFKFRVWDKYNEVMEEIIGIDFELNSFKFNNGYKPDRHNWGTADGYILMQCTGLQDRHGKLIYHGDILGYKSPMWTVLWEDGGYIVMDKTGTQRKTLRQIYLDGDIEIMGNIYENPELLTLKNENKR